MLLLLEIAHHFSINPSNIEAIKLVFIYSQSFFMMPSRINMGPVAEMMFKGWPEKSEKAMPQKDPARMHSIVPFKET